MTQIGEWAEDPEEMERREGPRRMWARSEVNLHKQELAEGRGHGARGTKDREGIRFVPIEVPGPVEGDKVE